MVELDLSIEYPLIKVVQECLVKGNSQSKHRI